MKSGLEFRDCLQGRGSTFPNNFRNIISAEKLDNFIKDVLLMSNRGVFATIAFLF
jgi:hypothetical protein